MSEGARSWAVIDAAGELVGLYPRRRAADLNAGDGAVVPGPPQGSNTRKLYWDFSASPVSGAWAERGSERDPMEKVKAGWDRRRRRQVAYGQAIESGEQFELLTDFMLWARAQPAFAAAMPEALKGRIDRFADKIAAIKAEHP
jgi:hypothetical protein